MTSGYTLHRHIGDQHPTFMLLQFACTLIKAGGQTGCNPPNLRAPPFIFPLFFADPFSKRPNTQSRSAGDHSPPPFCLSSSSPSSISTAASCHVIVRVVVVVAVADVAVIAVVPVAALVLPSALLLSTLVHRTRRIPKSAFPGICLRYLRTGLKRWDGSALRPFKFHCGYSKLASTRCDQCTQRKDVS